MGPQGGTPWEKLHQYSQCNTGKLPFGQLPLYEEPGLTLVQSGAIIRYLAKKHGFMGSNDREAALVDQAAEGIRDVYEHLIQVIFNTPEELQKAKEKFAAEFLPAQLGHFTKLLEKNGNNNFLVGRHLSYADLGLWMTLRGVVKLVEGSSQVVDSYPAIKAFLDGVSARDRIKAYVAHDVYTTK